MSSLAAEHNAINLGQGFPDFDPHPELIEAVGEAMRSGMNQYAPMSGIPALREAISEKINTLYGHRFNPDTEITVTNGATEALMVAIQAFVQQGDEVIVIEPAYDLYAPAIKLVSGTPVYVPLCPPNESQSAYHIDWEALKNAISSKTRAIMLNFPHNPTGITLKASDLDTLAELVRNTEILLIADEVYEHITYTEEPFQSLTKHPELRERSLVISSFGKTYHTTGWKIGYCSAPAALTAEFRKVHQFTVFSVSTPMQKALAQFAARSETFEPLREFYKNKHDLLLKGLQKSRLKPLVSQGTFFILADYSALSDMQEEEYAKKLTIESGLTAIPVSAFYHNTDSEVANNNMLRFCFAKSDKTLESAIEILQQL